MQTVFYRREAFKLLNRRTMTTRSYHPSKHVHLYLDWDGTITQRDTMSLLASIVAKRNSRLLAQGQSSLHSGVTEDPAATMTGFGQAYLRDFDSHKQRYRPQTEQRESVSSEKAWLESLKEVETASVQRVEKAGFFKGCNTLDVDAAAEDAVVNGHVVLREGWESIFLPLLEGVEGRTIAIISVNWSVTFIRWVLLHSLRRIATPKQYPSELLDQVLNNLQIYGNEIEGLDDDEAEGSSGLLSGPKSRNIRTSSDKEKALSFALKSSFSLMSTTSDGNQSLNKPYTVYVGDSTTDLGCLMAADVGICVRDETPTSTQTELERTLNRVGMKISSVKGHKVSYQTNDNILWFARDFGEILSFIGWHS